MSVFLDGKSEWLGTMAMSKTEMQSTDASLAMLTDLLTMAQRLASDLRQRGETARELHSSLAISVLCAQRLAAEAPSRRRPERRR